MTSSEIKNSLISVFNALNNIEVKGINNVGNLGGCMQVIQGLIEVIETEDGQKSEE